MRARIGWRDNPQKEDAGHDLGSGEGGTSLHGDPGGRAGGGPTAAVGLWRSAGNGGGDHPGGAFGGPGGASAAGVYPDPAAGGRSGNSFAGGISHGLDGGAGGQSQLRQDHAL